MLNRIYCQKTAGKQILIILLVLIMVWVTASGAGMLVFAEDAQMSGACGENASWTLTEKGTDRYGDAAYLLTISGSGAMYDYDFYSQAGYYWASDRIVSVIIENGITGIGGNAFSYCENLNGILIPDGITSIGKEAFYQCSRLEEITIPDSVTSIGMSAFDSCSRLAGISLPAGLTRIESHTFTFCSSLKEITIPDGVTEIGDSAFACCSNLREITIPDSVSRIGGTAFGSCEELTIVNYSGTEDQWKSIDIDNDQNGNDPLLQAIIHYDDSGSPDDPSPADNPFTDVQKDNYFFTPVLWAVKNEITKGTSDTTFSPAKPCTRAQAVTFLWRANGSEKAADTQNPFVDVSENDYYYDAVLWAIKNGVTNGMTETTFGTNEECTRGQIVTFLWRSEKEPAADSESSFADVGEKAFYFNAVRWAVEKEVTKGTSETTFSPDEFCTRGQIVTFLYRTLNEE